MNKKPTRVLLLTLIFSCLVTIRANAEPRPFTYYPSRIPSPDLESALRLGLQSPKESVVRLRVILGQTSDRALAGAILSQIADLDAIIGDKVAQRATLARIVRDYPNSNLEIESAYKLADLDLDIDDHDGYIRAVDTLVQRFGTPPLAQLADRQETALTKLRGLQPQLRKSLGIAFRCLPVVYSKKSDTKAALAFAQLNREMNFGGEDPEATLQAITGKSWVDRATQNPVVKILKPTSHRTGNRPRIVVEISDGDYREPQLNWEKFEFKLDGQDLKMKAMNKSQFDTQLRENRIFERLRMIYRPETPLAPGQHTLLIYAPVHGYKGTGLGATRLEYRFQVPPPNQRTSNDRDDEGAESDDRDFR